MKLASDEVAEVQRALSDAHLHVLRELSQGEGYMNGKVGLELCRRKWKLEVLLRQLDRPDVRSPVLELVPWRRREARQREAA